MKLLSILSSLFCVHVVVANPVYWNTQNETVFGATTKEFRDLGILREHTPGGAARQGAREFGIELQKEDDAQYFLAIASDQNQLEAFLREYTLTQILDVNERYWKYYIDTYSCVFDRGGFWDYASDPPIFNERIDVYSPENHNALLGSNPQRLDFFYDGHLEDPHQLSSSGDLESGYEDNTERTADYARMADFTSYLLSQYKKVFTRFFDFNADGYTDVQVSLASRGSTHVGSFATSFLYDNPMIGNELNTSPLSILYPVVDAQRERQSSGDWIAREYNAGEWGFLGRLYYAWIRVEGGVSSIGDIRTTFAPDAVRIAVAGDSFSSGEGASNEYYGLYNNFKWGRNEEQYFAHRSYNSHWHLAIKNGHRANYNNSALKHKTGIYHVDLSWSGAILYDLDPQDRWTQFPTSWRHYYGDEDDPAPYRLGASTFARQINMMPQVDYDALCFSHGGNDGGFADILSKLIFWDNYDDLDDDWAADMRKYGVWREDFAKHYYGYSVATSSAPPFLDQFSILKSTILAPGADNYNERLFRNFVINTYPNPVGYPNGNPYYPPFGHDGSAWDQFQRCSYTFGFEPVEADLIYYTMMGKINGPLYDLDEGIDDNVHIVGHNGRYLGDIPDYHTRGTMSTSPDRLFAAFGRCGDLPPSSVEDPRTMAWFHPDVNGHKTLFREAEEHIKTYFDYAYTKTRYSAAEHPSYVAPDLHVDLTFEESEIQTMESDGENWPVKLNVVVRNDGGVVSAPAPLMMQFEFNGAQITIPVRDLVTGQDVIIPAIAPSSTMALDQVILNSSTPCTGTKFLVSNLFSFISRAPYILDHLTDYPPEVGYAAWWVTQNTDDTDTLMRRLCGWVSLWNLHFNDRTRFSFFIPWDPNNEYNERAENNTGVIMDTWVINRDTGWVIDHRDCLRASLLECMSDVPWLADALKEKDVLSWVQSGDPRFTDFMSGIGIKRSVLYPILDSSLGNSSNAQVSAEGLIEESVIIDDPLGKGMFGGGELVLFPPGVEPLYLSFPDYPNIRLSYRELVKMNQIFVLDGSVIDGELVYNKDDKTLTQPLKIELPLDEYGIAKLGSIPKQGWEDRPLELQLPSGFNPSYLNYNAVDPFSNTVLKTVFVDGYTGTLRGLFENLYFTAGVAKVSLSKTDGPSGKGYWLQSSDAIGLVTTQIQGSNKQSANLLVELRGLIDEELAGANYESFKCYLSDGVSSHQIPLSLSGVEVAGETECQLNLKLPVSLVGSQFRVLEVLGQDGRLLAKAGLANLYLSEEASADVSPYLSVEDVVPMTLSEYLGGNLPPYVYRDPVDGWNPSSIVMQTTQTLTEVGSYEAKMTTKNSRGGTAEIAFTLQIIEDPAPDTDKDGLDDETELSIGTDPTKKDSDGDSIPDRLEVLNEFVGKENHPTVGKFSLIEEGVLEFETIIGKRYQLETSSDLVTWVPYGEAFRATEKSRRVSIGKKDENFYIRAKQY